MRPSNKKKNLMVASNSGVAMISVMITLTVCLLVATIVLQITYTSLLSRKVNTQASNNFYSAESAIDDVQTVLQSIAVYSSEKMGDDEFVDTVVSTLLAASGATSTSDTVAISKYLFNNLDEELKKVFGTATTDASGNTTYLYDSTKFKVSTVTKKEADVSSEKGSVTFSVELAYEDEDGYYTQISTDLVINDVVTRTPASAYSLGSYSMFTGGGAIFTGNDIGNTHNGKYYMNAFVQEGNAYIGMSRTNAPTALEINETGVIFDGNRVIINGDVYLNNNSALVFTGDGVVAADGTTAYTEVDVRGTIYIDETSVLVVGEGVDLMTQDIKLVKSDGSKWSVYESGKPSYIKCEADTFETITNYPYYETVDDMKDATSSSYTHVVNEHAQKKNGGCIVYTSDSGSYVLNRAGSKWVTKASGAEVNAKINYESSFMPQALGTFWGYDGTVQTVDAELAGFVNCEVLYWQSKFGDGGAFNMRYPYSAASLGTNVSKVELEYTTNTSGYSFDVSVVDGVTTSQYKALTSGSTYTPSTPFEFLDTSMNTCTFILGNVSEVVHANMSTVLWANQWQNAVVQVPTGSYVGTIISASAGVYTIQGSGASVGYSVLAGETSENGLENLVNQYKYVNFMQPSILDTNGNGSAYPSTTTYDYFYGLGMLDSLYVGGMGAFLDADNQANPGGDPDFSVTNMYDFITTENWQVN